MSASRRIVGTVLASALAIAGLTSLGGVAQAAAPTSPFDPPGTGSGATQGTLTLYDSSGNPVTSGPLGTAPAYVMADTDNGRVGDTKAALIIATPVKDNDAYTWPALQSSPATTYPLTTGAPADLLNKPNALVSTVSRWFDPTTGYQTLFPNTNSDAAWQDLYQLRVVTSGAGQVANPQRYASATIWLDSATSTWNVIYPNASSGTAPTVTTAAAISGVAKVGKTMSCSAAFDGTPTPTLAYRWKRGASNITGATKSAYKAVPADAGKSLSCVVTATNGIDPSASSTSPVKKVALGDPLRVTTRPSLTGMPKVGKILTCRHGAWSPLASTYSYQWLRGGKAIKGKTGTRYKLVKLDKGKSIACRVTAKKPGYRSGVGTTAAKRIKG